MALIENSKGRESGGGYERLFGNQLLGHLLSRVQASVISSGNELEHVIIAHSKSIADVDSFLAQQELPPGTYLITKKAIKKSALKSDQEPDLLVFEIEPPHRHCYIIELKDGDNFDTKKAAGEVALLQKFENHISKKLQFTTSIHVCSFNQNDKDKIVAGFKKKISIDMAMTGKELCDLLHIDYTEILGLRIGEQGKNFDYFISQLLEIPEAKEAILAKLFE